jgi:hypothetical protein
VIISIRVSTNPILKRGLDSLIRRMIPIATKNKLNITNMMNRKKWEIKMLKLLAKR